MAWAKFWMAYAGGGGVSNWLFGIDTHPCGCWVGEGYRTVAWLALPSLSRGASSFPRPDIFAQLRRPRAADPSSLITLRRE